MRLELRLRTAAAGAPDQGRTTATCCPPCPDGCPSTSWHAVRAYERSSRWMTSHVMCSTPTRSWTSCFAVPTRPGAPTSVAGVLRRPGYQRHVQPVHAPRTTASDRRDHPRRQLCITFVTLADLTKYSVNRQGALPTAVAWMLG